MSGKRVIVGCVALMVAGSVSADSMVFVGNADSGAAGVDYDFSIGQQEVSFSQWQASGIGGGATWTNNTPGVNAPAVNMNWHQAAQYCNWLTTGNVDTGAYTFDAGKVSVITDHDSTEMDALVLLHTTVYVLPTEAEWRKAAYWTGSSFSLYANGTGIAPINESDAVYGRTSGEGPWAVGTGTDEQNGTLNMMGNVWEWMESTANGEAYNAANDSQLMAFRGGDYFLGVGFLQETTRASDTRSGIANIGMRVVAIPEPGTISLMSLSTIGLFITRSVRRNKRAGKSLMPIRRKYRCDSFEEQDGAYYDADGFNYLTSVNHAAKARLLDAWRGIHSGYQKVDKTFWNWMVVSHENRMLKKQAFRESVKSKSLACLDAFLKLVMK